MGLGSLIDTGFNSLGIVNTIENGFDFNYLKPLYSAREKLTDPQANLQKITPPKANLSETIKLQIGVTEKDPTKLSSSGAISELPSKLPLDALYFPLSSNLKGFFGADMEGTFKQQLPDGSKRVFPKMLIPTSVKENCLRVVDPNFYLEDKGIFYEFNPSFIDGCLAARSTPGPLDYITSTNIAKFKTNNLLRFESATSKVSAEPINSWMNSIYTAEQVHSEHSFYSNIALAPDGLSIIEPTNSSAANSNIVLLSGPYELQAGQDYSFSLYAKSSLFSKNTIPDHIKNDLSNCNTELAGVYIIPYYTNNNYVSNTLNSKSYIVPEENNGVFSVVGSFPVPKLYTDYTLGKASLGYYDIGHSWQRIYKTFKCRTDGKYSVVVYWPANKHGTYNSNRRVTSGSNGIFKKLSLAGLYLEQNSTPSSYDNRYVRYIESDREVMSKKYPAIFDLHIDNSNKDWCISYYRKFEGYSISSTSAIEFIDSFGDVEWGYKGNKIIVNGGVVDLAIHPETIVADINSDLYEFNTDPSNYYNDWEKVIVRPLKNFERDTLEIIVTSARVTSSKKHYRYIIHANYSTFENSFKKSFYNLQLAGNCRRQEAYFCNGLYSDLLKTKYSEQEENQLFRVVKSYTAKLSGEQETSKESITIFRTNNIKEK